MWTSPCLPVKLATLKQGLLQYVDKPMSTSKTGHFKNKAYYSTWTNPCLPAKLATLKLGLLQRVDKPTSTEARYGYIQVYGSKRLGLFIA